MDGDTVVVDLEVDFHNEDATGFIWQWRDAARDPAVVVPDAIVVVGEEDVYAMAQVVDLVQLENGTIGPPPRPAGQHSRLSQGGRTRRRAHSLTAPHRVAPGRQYGNTCGVW